MTQPKILLLDIETSPVNAYVWQSQIGRKTRIDIDQIVEDMRIISYAAKFLDEKKIHYSDVRGQINDRGEEKLLKKIHDLCNEADVVIAHNGQAFDVPTILARFSVFDLKPTAPFTQIDTYLVSRKQFRFTSNKLEFLGKATKCPVKKGKHPKFPGMDLWKECLKDNVSAWREMRAYNIDDVLVLEWVYKKLRPFMKNHPNVAWLAGRPGCPNCGENKLQRRGFMTTRTMRYHRYQCSNCGAWTKGEADKFDAGKRKFNYKWSPK